MCCPTPVCRWAERCNQHDAERYIRTTDRVPRQKLYETGRNLGMHQPTDPPYRRFNQNGKDVGQSQSFPTGNTRTEKATVTKHACAATSSAQLQGGVEGVCVATPVLSGHDDPRHEGPEDRVDANEIGHPRRDQGKQEAQDHDASRRGPRLLAGDHPHHHQERLSHDLGKKKCADTDNGKIERDHASIIFLPSSL